MGGDRKYREVYVPFLQTEALLQLEDIKAETGIDTFNIEQDFSFREGLYQTLTKPEYWSRLGSSKNRTNDQKDESRNLINDILEACTSDTLITFTNGACHPNPGPCGAGACVYLPFETSPVNLKQPVSKLGSILLGEMIAIKMVLDFILEKLHQKRKLNKVLMLSDSQSSVGPLTLGWEATQRKSTARSYFQIGSYQRKRNWHRDQVDPMTCWD